MVPLKDASQLPTGAGPQKVDEPAAAAATAFAKDWTALNIEKGLATHLRGKDEEGDGTQVS